MIAGAMVFGVLTALLTEWLTSAGNVSEDASLGVVFTSLFAAGVVIISVALPGRHIDVDCILYGDFTQVPLRTSRSGSWEILPAAPISTASGPGKRTSQRERR